MKALLTGTLLASLLVVTSAAQAKPWIIDYSKSKLGFTGAQGSTAFQGQFRSFTAVVELDPAHPEAGKITTTVDIASATTNDAERDGMLPDAAWFNTSAFPKAQFSSDKISSTGPNQFEADGTLTIKGIARPVALPFTLVQDGDHWRAQGKTTLMRSDFHLGEGQFANDDTVKIAVDVTIDLSAKPAS